MAAGILRRFWHRRKGAIAPIFALSLIPLVVATGAVVDYANAFDKRAVVQAAMDSASLAAGKKIGILTLAQLKTDADNYYYTNVGTRLTGPPPLQVALQASTITLTTDLSVPTYFLGLIGLQHIDFHILSEATLAFGTLEVALVLDNSGSMATNNNIGTLQTAAINLSNTIFALGVTSNKGNPVLIGVVPFAAAVNVGAAYQNDAAATWLDKTGIGTYNLDIMDAAATTANPFVLLNGLKDPAGNAVAWGGCVESRPIPYDAADDAPVASTPASMIVPMFSPDEPDSFTCTSGTCSGAAKAAGVGSTLRFNAAPLGSQSLNNYLPDVPPPVNLLLSNATITIATPGVVTIANHHLVVGDQVIFATSGALPGGLTAGTTYYVKTVNSSSAFTLAATSGGAAIRTTGSQSGSHKATTSAMWTCANGTAACAGIGNGVAETGAMSSTLKYGTATNKVTMSAVTVGGIPGGPNFMCTSSALTPLTTNQTTVTSALNAMAAIGATNIEEGLMWGWRALSPGAPLTQGRAYTASDNQKILIFMTDGQNTYYPNGEYVGSWYGAWGFISKNHLGTTSTDQSVEEAKMDGRTVIACQNVKAAGIDVYTVAFTPAVDQATKNMLVSCASDPSMAYDPADQTALLAAFKAIGDQITQLRISR